MPEPIAVTGLGVVAPNGHSVDEFWRNCLAGVSGIRQFEHTDCSALDISFGGEIGDFDFSPFLSRREQQLFDISQQLAAAAAKQAWEGAGIGRSGIDRERVGVIIGSGAGAHVTAANGYQTLISQGHKAVSPYYITSLGVSMASSLVALHVGAKGPTFSVSGACASAAYALISAFQLLIANDADVVVAGGVEAFRHPTPIASFANMRALARHPDPTRASRPLDRDRSGFVFAEGAAAFTLEKLRHAETRGATIYGLLTGYGMTGDAGNLIAPDTNGIARSISLAIAKAGITPDEIQHVNLHASGTQQGDLAEAHALHSVLGSRAASVPVTAPKSLFGHAMGAAAGLEIVLLLKTLETGLIPPTINLENPDPAIHLNASKNPVAANIRTALKTSQGLGGLNAALVFERSGPERRSG